MTPGGDDEEIRARSPPETSSNPQPDFAGPELDMRFLSDEYGSDDRINFTGTFVGLSCNDLTGARKHADFDYFALSVKA